MSTDRSIIIISNATKEDNIQYYDTKNKINAIYKTKTKFYAPPESNSQVRQIARFGNVNDKGRLMTILCRDSNNIFNFYKYIKMYDNDIYKELKKSNLNTTEINKQHVDTIRLFQNRYPIIVERYLDFGAVDDFGKLMAESYDLKYHDEIKIVDGISSNIDDNSESNYKISYMSKKIPFSDNSFDFITSIMTLHHMKYIEEICDELYRILKPGGVLYLKEQNNWNSMDAMVNDIEHSLNKCEKHSIGRCLQYKNYHGWDKCFNKLKYITSGYYKIDAHLDLSSIITYWNMFVKPAETTL